MYVIDRTDGQVLQANPYGAMNSSKGVDLKTGKLILNPEKETELGIVLGSRRPLPMSRKRVGNSPTPCVTVPGLACFQGVIKASSKQYGMLGEIPMQVDGFIAVLRRLKDS